MERTRDHEVSRALAHMAALVLRPGARDVAELGAVTMGGFEPMVRGLDDLARRGGTLALVTGAYMAWAAPPAAETDGPVGAAVLARDFRRLGGRPVVVTDTPCADVVQACLDAAGPADTTVVRVAPGATREEVAALARAHGVDHVLAVERLGPSSSGRVLTMRAVDVTDHTAPLDALFGLPGVRSSAIGDGGNELGMGNLPAALLERVVDRAAVTACRVGCDDLLVAGVSNWGCYALAAGWRLVRSAAGLPGPDPAEDLVAVDRRLVAAAVRAGAVDGVTGTRGASVDGVPVDDYAPLLRALDTLAGSGPAPGPRGRRVGPGGNTGGGGRAASGADTT